jgi:NAD-dependent deacetylase
MPLVAKRGGARLVIINRDETPLDDLADLVIRAQAGPLMAAILEEVRKRMGTGLA